MHENELRIEEITCLRGRQESCLCAVILLINFHLVKSKNATNCMVFVRKCDRHYIWNQHPKISKKQQVLDFIQQ